MSVFNSLGSNYSWRLAIKNLFVLPSNRSRKVLEEELGKYYGGRATLTFKGRDALELGFKRSQIAKGSEVGISGFTCYVVYQAIVNAGYKPVFIDTAPNQIQFGVNELTQAHSNHPKLKAIVVQNTLGFPADIVNLEAYCQQHHIKIVEDLAHSTGAVYADGREAGKVGDFVMLSFSQDKPLDAVAGGALIDKQTEQFSAAPVSLWQRLKIRKYPILTAMIRSTYSFGVGRVLHFIFKKLHWLATPMNDAIFGLHTMSSATAKIVFDNWQLRDEEFKYRRAVAEIYKTNLPKELIMNETGQPAYLRFPIIVSDRQALVNFLKQSNIYIGDTWYDAPIAPKKYLSQTSYQVGTCPNSEKLAASIVNLPTHRHVNPAIALSICAKIKQWQASQQQI